MLHLIKYEIRRNLFTLLALYASILGIELFTLYSILTQSTTKTAISYALIIFCGFVGIMYIFIMGIQSYSKELGSKYSYMVFMTPNSTQKIITSKFLFIGVVALITSVISISLIVLDYNLVLTNFPQVADSISMAKIFTAEMGYDVSGLAIYLIIYFIIFWISIFSAIAIAYFAITLSATMLANKKGRGIISVVLFFILNFIISYVTGYFPKLEIGSGVINMLFEPSLTYIFHILIIICSIFGNAYLLDKKVSL